MKIMNYISLIMLASIIAVSSLNAAQPHNKRQRVQAPEAQEEDAPELELADIEEDEKVDVIIDENGQVVEPGSALVPVAAVNGNAAHFRDLCASGLGSRNFYLMFDNPADLAAFAVAFNMQGFVRTFLDNVPPEISSQYSPEGVLTSYRRSYHNAPVPEESLYIMPNDAIYKSLSVVYCKENSLLEDTHVSLVDMIPWLAGKGRLLLLKWVIRRYYRCSDNIQAYKRVFNSMRLYSCPCREFDINRSPNCNRLCCAAITLATENNRSNILNFFIEIKPFSNMHEVARRLRRVAQERNCNDALTVLNDYLTSQELCVLQ